jgi:MFS transporter, putative metabolite:H+ symporter
VIVSVVTSETDLERTNVERGAAVEARLDRIPASPYLWKLIALLSLGGFFEFYELFMTAFISPGLIRSGIFHIGSNGLFHLPDQASFASVTFLGLFLGTITLGGIADHWGRRAAFRGFAFCYATATTLMAMQSTAIAIDALRLMCAIAIGAQLITLDTYASEIVPRNLRGQAFALSFAIIQTAVPVLALLGWLIVPYAPLHIQGWRWLVLMGGAGSFMVWILCRFLPESPRWLARNCLLEDAERVTSVFEMHAETHLGHPLPAPKALTPKIVVKDNFAEILRPPYRSRTIMLTVFHFFQAIAFYGFGNWLPALVNAQNHNASRSAQVSFLITLAFPIGPLLWSTIAERYERKWQIVAAAGTAVFGLLFAAHTAPSGLVVLGILITLMNSLLGYSSHAYQAELFPTRMRARAVGFVYSWGRLSTALTSLIIGFLFQRFGSAGVFGLIAFSMFIVVIAVAVFGPNTRGLTLEQISD